MPSRVAAFYAFPNFSSFGVPSNTLQDRLLEEHDVAVVSGTSFGEWGEGFIRISCAASDADLVEAMGRIGRSLKSLIRSGLKGVPESGSMINEATSTASNAEPGMFLISWSTSLSQRSSGAPEIYQEDPLSARMIRTS